MTKTHLVIPDACAVCNEKPKKPSSASWCQDCANAYERERWAKTPKWKRYEKKLKSDYGITFAEFEEMYEAQNKRCWTCGILVYWDRDEKTSHQTACVDHCHSTGKVRGILCNHCNRALGLIKDDPVVLKKMMEYLNV